MPLVYTFCKFSFEKEKKGEKKNGTHRETSFASDPFKEMPLSEVITFLGEREKKKKKKNITEYREVESAKRLTVQQRTQRGHWFSVGLSNPPESTSLVYTRLPNKKY